jgi:hypothetical protein
VDITFVVDLVFLSESVGRGRLSILSSATVLVLAFAQWPTGIPLVELRAALDWHALSRELWWMGRIDSCLEFRSFRSSHQSKERHKFRRLSDAPEDN